MPAAENLNARPWMKRVLLVAGIYNLLWGTVAVVFPVEMLQWLGVDPLPVYPQFWQCIGMIVGMYGIGYLIAAADPYRHWPISLVGLLGKVFGPIGFALSVGSGTLPESLGWTLVTNDLIWWIPFAMILWGAVRHHQAIGTAYLELESDDPIRKIRSNSGERLDELANQQPQLVVFLRHAGCTFCRESLADISAQRSEIEAAGCGIVLVHMGDDRRDASIFDGYSLGDVPRFSDPECRLYRQFGLDLGGFTELFGPRVWLRGIIAGLLRGHGVGRLRGNGLQMPGVYLYHCGEILGGFQHSRASDRPDYLKLAGKSADRELTAAI